MGSPYDAIGSKFRTEAAGFPECRCPATAIPLKEWCDLLKHKPSPQMMALLAERGFSLHHIEEAVGGVNLDYYPVTITKMPTVNGRVMTPDQLLDRIRMHPNDFANPGIAHFRPLTEEDGAAWAKNPLGVVFGIDMRTLGINMDDGSVITSAATNRAWIFSTVYTPGYDWHHPVAGNREFGYTNNGDGTVVFYTRGADRLTTRADGRLNDDTAGPFAAFRMLRDIARYRQYAPLAKQEPADKGLPFSEADRLWNSYQQRIRDFVVKNGGKATVDQAISERHDFSAMQALCAKVR